MNTGPGRSSPGFRGPTARALLVPALLAFGSCSPLIVDEEEDFSERRLYVNDQARNDSLDAQVLRNGGVRFVLQPGKPYLLSVATDRASDMLDVYSLQGGGRKAFKKIPGIQDGGRQLFALTSPFATAVHFRARLLQTGSDPLTPADIEGVTLESQGEAALDTLQLKLFFVQSLRGIPTASLRGRFAADFFARMNDVLRPHGIAVAGVHEAVNPELGRLVFPFDGGFIPIGGAREPNHASIYLVDSISITRAEDEPPVLILGFAPREAADLSEDPESRVILANQAGAGELALTAVHELGHFFGLRHTVSSQHDMLQDDDFSNVEDGFTDTRFCRIGPAFLEKPSAATADRAPAGYVGGGRTRGAGGYCLRIRPVGGSMAFDNSCSEPTCDLDNLMHPYDCGSPQLELSRQQIDFLKRNMALYRR